MSKIKELKNHIKNHLEIFDRIVGNYKLNNPSSFLHEYLDYKSDNGTLRIVLVSNRMIKVMKQEGDTQSVEIVKLIGEEPTTTERIRKGSYRENIKRKYRKNRLISLSSTITFDCDRPENRVEIYLEEDKVEINQRDVSLLYKGDKNTIEGRYDLLKTYYSKQKDSSPVVKQQEETPSNKSKRQLIVEEQLREFIREEFDYKAPLETRDLEDLLRIMDMLIKRRKTTIEEQIQYTKK